MNSALEGDEVPNEPIRVWLHGDGFAGIDPSLQCRPLVQARCKP